MAPTIIEIPSPYYEPRTQPVDMLVVHAMGEWVLHEDGLYYYCTDLLNLLKLSVHALCLPDGRLIQTVDPLKIAYHAREFNAHSVGIEFVVAGAYNYQRFLEAIGNVNHSPFTNRQYKAGGWWLRLMAKCFGLTFQHIKTHKELAPDRKEDPGAAFHWESLEYSFNHSYR